jgi:hypothetical protein
MSLDGRMEAALDRMQAAKKAIARATESGDEHERQRCVEQAAMHLRRAAYELNPYASIRILSGPAVPE